jgi:hypothetical protein
MSGPRAPRGTRAAAVVGLALILIGPAALAVGGLASAAATAGSTGRGLFLSGPAHSHHSTSSTNWAGYAVTGSKGSVSKVSGSWIVPKIHGSCPSSQYQYSSFWVGIDGYSSTTVEQLGTDSDCQAGRAVYYAWYEFYPAASHLIAKLTITPGDTISASVSYASGAFTVKMTDLTSGGSFSKTHAMSASRTSAEWIAEAPASSSGILPLADFGSVQFGYDATSVSGTCTATVGGTSGDIASFSTAIAIDMVTQKGSLAKATPTALSSDGTSFNVTWYRTGP